MKLEMSDEYCILRTHACNATDQIVDVPFLRRGVDSENRINLTALRPNGLLMPKNTGSDQARIVIQNCVQYNACTPATLVSKDSVPKILIQAFRNSSTSEWFYYRKNRFNEGAVRTPIKISASGPFESHFQNSQREAANQSLVEASLNVAPDYIHLPEASFPPGFDSPSSEATKAPVDGETNNKTLENGLISRNLPVKSQPPSQAANSVKKMPEMPEIGIKVSREAEASGNKSQNLPLSSQSNFIELNKDRSSFGKNSEIVPPDPPVGNQKRKEAEQIAPKPKKRKSVVQKSASADEGKKKLLQEIKDLRSRLEKAKADETEAEKSANDKKLAKEAESQIPAQFQEKLSILEEENALQRKKIASVRAQIKSHKQRMGRIKEILLEA